MKVYIVTSGEYSDYTIDAVFLDKKKAAYWAAEKNTEEKYRNYRVEDFNSSDEAVDISDSRQIMYRYTPYENGFICFGSPKAEFKSTIGAYGDNYCIISSKRLSQTKVDKIVADLRTQYFAKKEELI